jgi:PDDEXK-like domain of unknown function (DUF3799)
MNAQLKPADDGLIYDLPAEQYHVKQLGEISNSGIKRLLRSPAHYKAWVEDDEENTDTPALVFGRAFHCALLEPAVFAQDYAVEPDFGDCRFKEARAVRDEWRAANAGKLTISDTDMQRIQDMTASVLAHPIASRAIKDGRPEVTLKWTDEITGLPCKARADYFVDGKVRYVLDVKTCEDASPEVFAKAVHKYGYHVQHAHYSEGFRSIGLPLSNYLILAIEHKPPYAVAVYHIDAAAEVRGFELRQRAIDAAKQCIDSGKWPAYSTNITALALPAWALKD